MSFLRGSANYVWCTTSVLGKGATGAVFQGVNKVIFYSAVSSHVFYSFCIALRGSCSGENIQSAESHETSGGTNARI